LKKAVIKSVLSKVLNVVFVLIFLFGTAAFVIAVSTRGGSVPNILGFSFLRVTTGSMAPQYSVGDILETKRVEADTLKVGDVISFYSEDPEIEGIPNTHRIVEIITERDGSHSFVTKGDANPERDKYKVHEDRIIGRVERKIVGLNRIIGFFQSDSKFFIFILVPVIVIAAFEVRNFMKLIKEKDEAVDDKNEHGQPGIDEKAEKKE